MCDEVIRAFASVPPGVCKDTRPRQTPKSKAGKIVGGVVSGLKCRHLFSLSGAGLSCTHRWVRTCAPWVSCFRRVEGVRQLNIRRPGPDRGLQQMIPNQHLNLEAGPSFVRCILARSNICSTYSQLSKGGRRSYLDLELC